MAHVESAEVKAVVGLVRNLSVLNAAIVVGMVAYAQIIALPTSQIILLVITAMLSAVPVALPATFTWEQRWVRGRWRLKACCSHNYQRCTRQQRSTCCVPTRQVR